MKKRFTDADKWDDEWFRELPSKIKTAWEFLRDRCDSAGFWKKDFKLMNFLTNDTYSPDEILKALNHGKKRILDHGPYWEIREFISFQYGVLSHACRPHKPIFELLEKYRKKGYQKGINTLSEKPIQEKDKTVVMKEFRDLKNKLAKGKSV
jgi:hypothetical protein